jgi:hypothetical protein
VRDERGHAIDHIASLCEQLHLTRVWKARNAIEGLGPEVVFAPPPEPDFRAQATQLLDAEIVRSAKVTVTEKLRRLIGEIAS